MPADSTEMDTDFSIRLTKEAGVTTIPVRLPVILALPLKAPWGSEVQSVVELRLAGAIQGSLGMKPLTSPHSMCFMQVSAFYVSSDPPRTLVRFCFCKTDDKLRKACDALEDFFGKRRSLPQ